MPNLIEDNLILDTDSYKFSHWRQYPPGTSHIYSFYESRGGAYDQVVFFGLQYILKRYFTGKVLTREGFEEAREVCAAHFGGDTIFYADGWDRLIRKHDGRLPISIRAVPEGSVIPTRNVLMTIENTDPEFPWLTNYVETMLSQVWYPCTVATQSWAMRQVILNALERTGDPGLIDFKLHDFGFRGSTSRESAGIGAAAHLVNFKGTDTTIGLRLARNYYGEHMAGFSIPAAEHSTITSWGRENEVEAYRNMLKQFPTGLVAVVSDSYDIFRACKEIWGSELRDAVIARDGVLVIRPDSGDPTKVIPEILRILGLTFGVTTNSKGYWVLNPKVRVIQGDGINPHMVATLLNIITSAGWSADNLTFGSGGALLQKMDRDTLKFAIKCSQALVGDEWRDVIKDPVTDPGKKSKAGRLKLIVENGEFRTVRFDEPGDDLLQPVFLYGTMLRNEKFSDIRVRASR